MKYYIEPLVQIDDCGTPVVCGTHVKWLEPIIVKAFTLRRAHKKAFNKLNRIYPQYKDMIQIW